MTDAADRGDPLFRQELFFWCCAVVSLLALLGSHSLFGDEPFVAEAAREIVRTGRWRPLTLNFADTPERLPVLEVWFTALALKIGVSEFAARLPSALLALILLVGVRDAAIRLFGRGAALFSGWLTLGTCALLYLGRSCGSGIFSTVIAVWAVNVCIIASAGWNWWQVFALGALLVLGTADRGLNFLWLALALLAPWLYAARRSPGFRWWRVAAAAAAMLAACGLARWGASGGDPLRSALMDWCDSERSPVNILVDLREVPRITLPWSLISVAVLGGALFRFRTLTRGDRCLLADGLLGFLVLLVLPFTRWLDFLPLMPFLALETGAGLLRGDGGKGIRWAILITRGAIIVLASFGVVLVVTVPVWKQLFGFNAPWIALAASFVLGGAVLLIMMFDSCPTRPLARISGLPDLWGSTVLGGTLATICLVSFLIPSLRELRSERRQFMLTLRTSIGRIEPDAVICIGGMRSAANLLFYTDMPGPINVIPREASGIAAFGAVAERHRGGTVAVVARYRDKEQDFLRLCAGAARLDINTKKPDLKEELPEERHSSDQLRACWLAAVPETRR